MNNNYKTNHNVPSFEDLDAIADSELGLFHPENPDINLFNLVDDELIKLGGSKLKIYKYYQGQEYDPIYMESQDKPIMKDPIIVYGHYEPKALEENLTEFGIELTNDQLFTFNKHYIERKLKRSLIPGDIIEPLLQNQKYEIFEVQEDSFEAYGVYHLVCSAKLLRDADNIQTDGEDVEREVNPGFMNNIYGE